MREGYVVQPLTAEQIRASFVNTTRSRLKAMTMYPGLGDVDWQRRDYLGWTDSKAPARAYLVAPHADGIIGLELRRSQPPKVARAGSSMCDLCRSGHRRDDVALFVARKAGAAGRADNTVGAYICADLACSLYVRNLKDLDLPQGDAMVPVGNRVNRLRGRLAAFVDRALAE
jgi:hypothetical protein